jgi:putative transposase
MRYDSDKQHRQSIRLKGYDYSRFGTYFITVCTWQKECSLSKVNGDSVALKEVGRTVETVWHSLPERFSVQRDSLIIMPNHLHGILLLQDDLEKTATLGNVMRAFKSLSGIAGNRLLSRSERPFW